MLGGCLAHLLVLSVDLVCLLVKGSQLWFDCLRWLLAEFILSLGTLVPFGTSEARILPAPLVSDLTLVSFAGLFLFVGCALGTRVPSGTREVRQPFYTGVPVLLNVGVVAWYTGACLDLIVGDV
jgi:hypothetical protein